MQGKALPGFRDFYPEDLTLRNHIFATWRSVAARYGFEEYDGPPLESLEMYTQKSGDEIVQQLYSFRDKGEREVALRPEMTPTLARMVAARVQALKKPIRWFSIPQLFRYERQQRGRLREHFQLNMDIIGEASPLADAELMAAAVDIMRAFGLGPKDVRLRVSDRRLLKALLATRGITEPQLPVAFAVLDRTERVPKNVLEEMLREAGYGEHEMQAVFQVASLPGEGALGAGGEAAEPLRQAVAALEAMGLGDMHWVLNLADAMRERGIAVEYGLRHTGVRKQLELAAARGAPRAVIIGPEERQAGLAVVRDLKAGTEAKVPFDKLLNGYFD